MVHSGSSDTLYICPMHREVTSKKNGKCFLCLAPLVPSTLNNQPNKAYVMTAGEHVMHNEKTNFIPLFTILAFILYGSFLATIPYYVSYGLYPYYYFHMFMMYFMGGFFLVFSCLKLLDLKGFANGYAMYDLIAKKFYWYGYVYPFIELALGTSLLLNFHPLLTNFITFVVMFISGLGVSIKLRNKEYHACACLGTFIKVPLTNVTLIEDFGMAAMALYMVLVYLSLA